MSNARDYWLHGLRIRSELDLPELSPALKTSTPDVTVRRGPVECTSTGGKMSAIPDGAMFEVPGTARYSIHRGSEIVVDAEVNAPARNVRLFLIGSAMGMLIHQRGLLPLHANTIIVGGKAVLFMGHSGAGKSTLAAWFHDLGYTVLGDDVSVVRFRGAEPTVSAGLPRLRLWKDSLQASGRDHSGYALSYDGKKGLDKYDVPLEKQLSPHEEIDLAGVYILARGSELEIEPLRGLEAAEAVIANTYRGEYVQLAGNSRNHWEACARLVQRTPVLRLERPWNLAIGSRTSQRILEHLIMIGSQGTKGPDSLPGPAH